jgi:hypothetical protein
MKTLIAVIVLCVFAYSSVGAILKSVDIEQKHVNEINKALAMASK